jgi:hypothetical protein
MTDNHEIEIDYKAAKEKFPDKSHPLTADELAELDALAGEEEE